MFRISRSSASLLLCGVTGEDPLHARIARDQSLQAKKDVLRRQRAQQSFECRLGVEGIGSHQSQQEIRRLALSS